jgi:hypothetical protein
MATVQEFGKDDGGEVDIRDYQSMIGSVMYLMVGTRPDLAYAIGVLSRFSANPKAAHLSALKRIFRYIKNTSKVGITLGGQDNELLAFADAAFGDDRATGHSTSGYVIMLGDGPVSWSSKRQSLVTQSTTEAEYVGASQAAREVMWIRGILEELGYSQDSATKIFGDNQSALKLAHNVEYHPRTKHINIRYHFICDCVQEDALTKSLGRDKHMAFAEAIGLEMSRSGGSVGK